MNHTSRFQVLQVLFHVPPAVAEQALSDWSFAEVARRHAPDLAPFFAHLAFAQIAPHAVTISSGAEGHSRTLRT